MNCIIRTATSSDAATLAAIGAATFALGDSPATPAADLDAYVRNELTAARFAEHLQNPSIATYVADADGAPAGYLMLRSDGRAACIAHAKHALRLWRIYVLRAFHGSGVAAALMETAFAHARAAHCDILWLGVSEHNARGQAFYRKHGFRVVGDEQFHVGPSAHHDVIMARTMEQK
jgi:ribosomal protein S18 acetylase RimI-like enzyme